MEKWKNKVAVVTGASSGIGLQITKDLASHGIKVVGMARNVEKIEEASIELFKDGERKIYSQKCDISNSASVQEAFKIIEEKFSVIHIFINNAGILHKASILDISEETTTKIDNVINTNFRGAVHCARHALRLLTKANDFGIVININSIAGHNVYKGLHISNVYSPTKFALTSLSEILRQELIVNGCNKIRVSNLSPGVVSTEIMVRGEVFNCIDDYTGIPHILARDISNGVLYILSTAPNVEISQLTIKPVGERK